MTGRFAPEERREIVLALLSGRVGMAERPSKERGSAADREHLDMDEVLQDNLDPRQRDVAMEKTKEIRVHRIFGLGKSHHPCPRAAILTQGDADQAGSWRSGYENGAATMKRKT